MPVSLEKRLLVNVLGVLFIAEHVQRQTKDGLIVAADEGIEGGPVATLGLTE